jgi:hypothetical protein
MLRIPHCLDNWLKDDGKVVSSTQPPHFTPQKHYYFYDSGTHFCYRLSKPQVLVRPEGLGNSKNHLIGYRTRDLPVCSIVPLPLRYRMSPLVGIKLIVIYKIKRERFLNLWNYVVCLIAHLLDPWSQSNISP